jgi:signal recognition particle receptor subunit beta
MREEHKVLFTGTMGAGKTTAISSVSAVKMVKTEAHNTDKKLFAKATTTVGFDYGEVALEDGSVLRLYGTPGQRRFQFMWKIVARGALGVVVLVDNARPDPIADLDMYLENFREFVDAGAVVIGVGRTETHLRPTLDDYYLHLGQLGLLLPVFNVDVRRGDDVLMLLDVLFGVLEMAGGGV